MSFQSQYADYKSNCYLPKLRYPMTVPFMNSLPSSNTNNEHIARTDKKNTNENENKYYIDSFSGKEYFHSKQQNHQQKKSNDFALGWTCTQRQDGSWYCPLRGDKY